jgi:hypothetical protein
VVFQLSEERYQSARTLGANDNDLCDAAVSFVASHSAIQSSIRLFLEPAKLLKA